MIRFILDIRGLEGEPKLRKEFSREIRVKLRKTYLKFVTSATDFY